jgi:hypothetical protein
MSDDEWSTVFSVAGFELFGVLYQKNANAVPLPEVPLPNQVIKEKEEAIDFKKTLQSIPLVTKQQLDEKKMKVTIV